MATPKGTHFVVTANLLQSGACVWRGPDGTWRTNLQEAHPATTQAEGDTMLAAAKREEGMVADPYVFPVHVEGTLIDPLTARELIRATGPTVPYRRPDRAA